MVAAVMVQMWEGPRAFHICTMGKEVFLETVCGTKRGITECRKGSILFAGKGSKVLTIYRQGIRQGRGPQHRIFSESR
jgi:hypothetical protein